MDENIDNNKTYTDASKIEFNGIQFRDINEFVVDLQNIFVQLTDIYNNFEKKKIRLYDPDEILNLKNEMEKKLAELYEELKQKLEYITDPNQVDASLVGDIKHTLVQFKNFIQNKDIINEPEIYIKEFKDFYYNRILDQEIASIKNFHSYKK